MTKLAVGFGFLAAMGLTSAAAAAQRAAEPQPAEFRAVVACRAETDEAARLRCYDQAVAALDQAASQGAVLLSSREQVRAARRSLFGFPIPRFLLGRDDAGGDEPEAEAVRELHAVVRYAGDSGFNKYVIDLVEGGRWHTMDNHNGAPAPRAGDQVTIRRGALGGYMMTGRGLRAMRVRRVE